MIRIAAHQVLQNLDGLLVLALISGDKGEVIVWRDLVGLQAHTFAKMLSGVIKMATKIKH